jgi:hypothetical protein
MSRNARCCWRASAWLACLAAPTLLTLSCARPVATTSSASPAATRVLTRTYREDDGRQRVDTVPPPRCTPGGGDTVAGRFFWPFEVARPATVRQPGTFAWIGGPTKVIAQFVVDTVGRAEVETFKVIEGDRDAAAAVREGLPTARYAPAVRDGCRVRQLTQQPFLFR